MRSMASITFKVIDLIVVFMMAFGSPIAVLAAPSPTGATITSDLPDYPAGATVTLTGTGWVAFEPVHIFVNDNVGQTWKLDSSPDPIADESGAFLYKFNLPVTFVASYAVTATGGLTSGVATTTFTDAPPSLQQLWQCDPPTGYNPATYTCVSASATGWVSGNDDGPFMEGETVPYRTRFQNLVSGNEYSITIEWDTTKGGKHALDYLKTYNATIAAADPCLSLSGLPAGLCSTSSTWAIPPDTFMQSDANWIANGAAQDAGEFTMFGGEITGVSSYTNPPSYAGDTSTSITIFFTANSTDSVLAWGGHIADRADWGADNSAVTISGSPYHMRILSWFDVTNNTKNNVGNMDRSLSAEAVIYPGSITIIKDATPNGSTVFPFTASPAPLSNFSLVDDGTSANTKVFSDITNFVTYTVNETPIPAGWAFDLASCSVTSPNGGSATPVGATVTINMKEGEEWTCTYTNHQQTGYLKITKAFDAKTSGFNGTFDIVYNCGAGDVTVSLAAGASTTVGPFPVGTACTVTEPALPTPPTGWTFGTPSISGSPATIVAGDQAAAVSVTVTNSITRDQGYLKITKVFDPLTSGFNGTFDIVYNCGASDVTVSLAAGGSTTVGPFDTGTVCTVTEPATPTPPADWVFGTPSISGSPATIVKGDKTSPVLVSVTNTITHLEAAIQVEKSPSVTNVCAGKDAQVEYTYKVTNTGDVALTGNLVDDAGTPGNTADDVIIGAFTNLAPGADETFYYKFTVNATTTNIVTATGTSAGGQTVTATATSTVTARNCSISITKTPSTLNVCNGANTPVEYIYVVTNNSNQFNVSGTVTDDQFGTIGSFGPLAPGASATLKKTATVNGTVTNIATANGTFDDAGKTTATATATATVTGHVCTITVTKTPAVTNVCNGSPVAYTYEVKNNSDFFTWTGSLTDDKLTLPAGAASFSVDPGKTVTFTASGAITGTVINTATATGKFNDTVTTTASDEATATVTGHACTISITKTPSTANVCAGSETKVTYTYVVTNTGDFFNVSGSVSDDKLGTVGSFGPLAPGAYTTLTKDAEVGSTVTNTATATGTFSDGLATQATATATATVTAHDCTITVTKTPSQANVCNGTSVTYTYTVKNNSDFYTWTGTLTDDKLGAINGTITLTPGQTKTFTASGSINGAVTNTATATGKFDDTAATAATDSATATVTGHTCTLSITKTPSTLSVCSGSETPVTYTYVVKNTGDFFSVSGSVTDDKLGTIGSFGPLAPNATATLTKVATVSHTLTNTATANGTFTDAAGTTASATATATVTEHSCTITVTKTPSQTNVCNGSTVEYTYVVTNGSDLYTWTGTLVDDKLGAINGTITLAPGESKTFTASAIINGALTNTVTASGKFDDPAGSSASDKASATVTGHVCTISVEKTPSTANVCAGSDTKVTYTYEVTNNSDFFKVTGTVTDDKLSAIGSFTALEPGKTITFSADTTIDDTVTNKVTAEGTFDDAAQTAASDTATATVTSHTCTISITKTPSVLNVCNGSNTPVTYTYVVKNTGNFFSVSGTVTDDKFGTIGTFGPLAPGATATLTKATTVTGSVTNTATADGTFTDTAATKATATASATVTGHACTVTITKTPSVLDVCNGSNTPVTYTYVVKNTSDFFALTGSVVDDKLGPIATITTPLAPGQELTFKKVGAVTGTLTNTATVNATFNDSIDTTASATASATVTGHTCTISLTKTPSTADVCNGSNTQVTYTYVVKNTGDFFDASGTLTDNVLGAIGPFGPLAPGETATLTKIAPINGTQTNTGTANATFDDSIHTTAKATASATVTGHACTLTITKTPSVTNVCNGANTVVNYTYVVTNTGDFFKLSGSVTDDVLGSIGDFGPLAPGEHATLSATTMINDTLKNVATANGVFDDVAATAKTATATATVTGHVCTITVTKTPRVANVCNGATVTYDYKVKNNSDFYTWTGTLTDDKLGAINGTITLLPGASQTFTGSAAITGEVTNTATASGTFNDSTVYSASATASATVNGHVCRITVKKVTAPSGDPQLFPFTGDLSGSIADGGSITKDVLTPGAYTTTEGKLTGWDLTGILCSSTKATGSVSTATATYNVALDDNLTCTFVNTKRASLTIVKKIVNDNGGAAVVGNFGITTSAGALTFAPAVENPAKTFTYTSNTLTNLIPNTKSLHEGTLFGYTEGPWTCDGKGSVVSNPQTGSVQLLPGENVTCTIVNNDQPGKIIIIKNAKPQQGTFQFTTTGAGYTGFTLNGATTGGGNQNVQELNAGTYTVKELTQAGWILTGIGGSTNINTPYACVVTGSNGSTGSGSLGTQTATINLKFGDTVTCYFENTSLYTTRTQGFWATHPQLANIAWFGGTAFGHTFPGVANTPGIGDTLICGRPIDTLAKLMGGFWANISKTTNGVKRTALDQARMRLLQQLLAAELNASAFNSVPSVGSIAAWETALCSNNITAIQTAQKQAAAFNSSGDNGLFTPGTSADSKTARAIANRLFWNIIKPAP